MFLPSLIPTVAEAMGLCLGKATSPWADLPPEIAGEILSRLLSDDDRISFGVVCRDWRLATRVQPPSMPCINLGNGTYQSIIANGKARHFATPKGYRARTSFDNWVMYEHGSSDRRFLRAPFSPLVPAIEVPCCYLGSDIEYISGTVHDTGTMRACPMDYGYFRKMKMVVCSSRLVVAILRGDPFGLWTSDFRHVEYTNFLCFLPNQNQQLPAAWLVLRSHDPRASEGYKDIGFFRGKIFALTASEKLFCHDSFADNQDNYRRESHAPLVDHAVDERPATSTNSYLVVSSDEQKLLMVRCSGSITDDNKVTMDLRVFEADFDEGRWLEVKDLAGQVLFLSRNCSKALPAGSLKHHDYRFQRGNCVLVLGTEWARTRTRPTICENETPIYCVYDMVSGEGELVSLDRAPYMESSMSGWFFPS